MYIMLKLEMCEKYYSHFLGILYIFQAAIGNVLKSGLG